MAWPRARAVPSIADMAIRIDPPKPASICAAVWAAAPSAFRSSSARPRTPSADCDSTLADVMPSRPKAWAIFCVRSATDMFCVAVLISSRICTSGLRLPAASVLVTPKSFSSSAPDPAEITDSRRSAVPASLPWMPTLPRAPRRATVSSNDIPRLLATGPAYFRDSPRPSTVLNVLLAALVNTSAARAASPAPMPNCRSVAAMIPEASVASVPVARARSKTAPVIRSISSGLKPARPSSVIRLATWTAVNDVVAPSSRALSLRDWRAAPLAPETAAVARMASSNVANCLAARPSGAAMAAPMAVILAPRFIIDAPILPTCLLTSLNALNSLRGSAPISTTT